MLNAHPREGSASIVILLTDGDPTSGVTNLELIQSNVRRDIADKFPLYCLGFGYDVNFEFLEKMSLQNNGVARRIYEDSDADLQLKGFYEEVATPLLTDVTMIYNGGTNLTQTNFSQYYNGSEIVVAGQITDNDIETFTPQVVAISRDRRVTFSETNATVEYTGTDFDSHIQRVWAYLTVKQLLEKELLFSGPEKENVKKEALELSLKYSFVTPLTSMVVTKPLGENTDVLHKPKEGERTQALSSPVGHRPLPKNTVGMALQGYGVSFTPQMSFPVPGGWPMPMDIAHLMPAQHMPARHRSQGVSGGFSGHTAQLMPAQHIPDRRLFAAAEFLKGSPTNSDQVVSKVASPVPLSHRFLLKTENLSLPLCFDVTGDVRLKLLHHPNRELSVNGELDTVMNGGFRRIVIHFKTDLYVEVDTNVITVREGQTLTRHTGQDLITAGSLTVIRRDKEIDVGAGDTRMVIYIHEKDGVEFLWPVLRQQPLDNNVTGIIALKPAVYEEVQQTPSTKLKIKDQEIDVTRANAVDYSIVSPPTLDCWLMSAESVLQRRLDDFIVTQL
uniref:VWFA domain-containing protein n=2 Tax=Sander lucioperca TaxID=283035 RepID=A0A8C9ZV99_SANLU